MQYSLTWNGRPFCKTQMDSGFAARGGIVCLLDADYGTFLRQLRMMLENSFIQESSSTLAVDFVAYNGNNNMLTYVVMEFSVSPGGTVSKRLRIQSLSLIDFDEFLDAYGTILTRVVPGVMYILLVMKFAFDFYWDLQQEIYRKKLNENSSWFVAAVEFITLDVFNMLEAISISISVISFILYIMWLVAETTLGSKLDAGTDLNGFLDYCMSLASQARLYNRLSAVNCLLIFIRPLKFVRQSVRFAQLYQTMWDAQTDIAWFVFMFTIAMFGFVMFSHVSFGPSLESCRTIVGTFHYLFHIVIGNVDYSPLKRADPFMAPVFFIPYLLLFCLVFLNIFFAIIDRYYVPKESPPLNLKRRLKPVFQRLCRWIEWDEDYVMEQNSNEENKKKGPPSRQTKVKELVHQINSTSCAHDRPYGPKGSKMISEVCDADDKMGEVLHWSRDEASSIVLQFHRMLQKKHTVKNDEVFIKTDVMSRVRDDSRTVRGEMEEAERLMRYATKVHEQMAMRDQETLAKYILILELKIRNRMKQQHELNRQVAHLKSESDKMRYTNEELNRLTGAAQVRGAGRSALEHQRERGFEASDGETSPAGPLPALEAGPAAHARLGSGDGGAGDADQGANAPPGLRS